MSQFGWLEGKLNDLALESRDLYLIERVMDVIKAADEYITTSKALSVWGDDQIFPLGLDLHGAETRFHSALDALQAVKETNHDD